MAIVQADENKVDDKGGESKVKTRLGSLEDVVENEGTENKRDAN